MIRLFLTSVQKYGRWIASVKWSSVGCSGNQVGVRLTIWSFGLNAVEIIQNTGNTITTKTATPTTIPRALLHVSTPIRTMRRTYTMLSTPTIASISSEIAAPRP